MTEPVCAKKDRTVLNWKPASIGGVPAACRRNNLFVMAHTRAPTSHLNN